MFQKLKNLFKKESKGYLSALQFKESIKALGMETYKGVTILYLSKPKKDNKEIEQPIYHLFYNKEFYFKEADNFQALQDMAHYDIDNKFKNHDTEEREN